ncbi:MAG: OPT family oligopeptide transporter [Nannocystaceae bacterium]
MPEPEPEPEPEPAALPTLATHTPEQIQRAWRDQVYRGDHVPQLTLRALLTGSALGAITGVSNLYVGLKVGWSLGVVITASILGWAVWHAAGRVGLLRRAPSVLEANAMASTASAAGYSTGTTLAAAMAAHLMLTGHHLPVWQLGAWILSISMLGLFVAVPLKRMLVDAEQLPFPSGAAAAETLRSLYAQPGTAARRARALVMALGVGVLVEAMTAVVPGVMARVGGPDWLGLPGSLPTAGMVEMLPALGAAVTYGFSLEVSVLLPAAGVLVGWRVAWSLLLGAVVCFGMLAPWLVEAGTVATPGYRDTVAWSVWPGATMMVVAGLASLVVRWRSVGRALASLWRGRDPASIAPLADIEVPAGWVVLGGGAAALGCIVLQVLLFEIPVVVAMGAVVLAVVLAVVAARVTGETDITPMGPLGKLAQLAGGVALPGRAVPNLMVASVTAGAAASAADLLTDLKSGVLLGAHPRRQFLAQAAGVLVGVVVVVPVFRYVLVPDAAALGGDQWPAPAARVWASVSTLLGQGVGGVPESARWAALAGAALAGLLAGLEHVRPRWRRLLPSATGLGLAFVLPASSSLSFFIGGLVAWGVARRRPGALVTHAVPIAAGLIAGESLMGVVGALLTAAGR